MAINTVTIEGNKMTVESTDGQQVNMVIADPVGSTYTDVDQAAFIETLMNQWEQMDSRVVELYADLYGSADSPLTVGLDSSSYAKGGAQASFDDQTLTFADPNLIPQALQEGGDDFNIDHYVPGGYVDLRGHLIPYRYEDTWYHEGIHLGDEPVSQDDPNYDPEKHSSEGREKHAVDETDENMRAPDNVPERNAPSPITPFPDGMNPYEENPDWDVDGDGVPNYIDKDYGFNDDGPGDGFDEAEVTTSPLVLDLDQDGIETTSLGEGVYFDHDKNGLAEKTGWVGSDDGLLVLDRNSNGTIDDGAELFGNETILNDGTKAANGFAALAELDDNSDGRIDTQDTAFSQLRVWQDLNGDGVSQESELKTLTEWDISSINTGYQSTSVSDGNGNTIRQVGAANLSDDSSIDVADVWFASDKSQTIDRTTSSLTPEILALPEVSAFGNVANLRQSMLGDTELEALVEQFVSAPTINEKLALIDQIIYQWTGSADVDPYSRDPSKVYGHVMDARQLVTLENLVGRDYQGTWCWGERDPNPHGQAAPKLIAEYQQFKGYVTAQLLSQTVYSEYFSEIGINYNYYSESFSLDVSGFIDRLKSELPGNEEEVIGVINTFKGLSTYSSSIQENLEELKADSVLGAYALDTVITGTEAAETLSGGSTDDFIRGHEGNDVLLGGRGNDHYFFELGDGSDRIYDADGVDNLRFGLEITAEKMVVTRNLTSLFITLVDDAGEATGDAIQIDNVFDFDGRITSSAIENIYFSDGTVIPISDFIADFLVQEATEGDDTLYGTELGDTFNGLAGDDLIYGGSGNDTYQFGFGDGNDTIVENAGTDSIDFINGVLPENVKIERVGTDGKDLVLHLYDENGQLTGDSITIINAYEGFNASSNRIENVTFTLADASIVTLSLDDLEKIYSVTSGDDVVYGFESNDVIASLTGIDEVHGAGGNDTLIGDEDDDSLYGEQGDDAINGAGGNDWLDGGLGNDTYFFASGDGHDIINNNDSSSVDVLEFDSSINPNKVRLLRVDNDLFISIDRNSDSIQVKNYFNGDVVSNTALDEIRFSDGSVLTIEDVMELTLDATQQADYIEGFATDDTISTRGGDDIVYGKGGDDLISGDQGNDLVFGENGNDALFGQQGADQLYGGQGNDLINGGSESDELYGGTGEDTLNGGNDDDLLYGGSQNDSLYGESGNDTLYGESGNDTIIAGSGDDSIYGGQGDDFISTGHGDDTVFYSVGDGNDTISGDKNEANGHDVLSLTGFATDDVWLTEENGDLHINFIGSDGQIVVQNWQTDSALDEIQLGEYSAQSEDVERLVSAMAAYDVQTGAGTILPQEVEEQLQPVITSSWHSAN